MQDKPMKESDSKAIPFSSPPLLCCYYCAVDYVAGKTDSALQPVTMWNGTLVCRDHLNR